MSNYPSENFANADYKGRGEHEHGARLLQEAVEAFLRDGEKPPVRVPGQRQATDIQIPELSIHAMGMAPTSRSEFYLYTGGASKALSIQNLTKVDLDGSSYARVWDGKRSAEVHWGDRADQRYILYPMSDKTWMGDSETPNDGTAATSVKHFKSDNGSVQLKFSNGRTIQFSNRSSGEIRGTGERPSDNFVLRSTNNERYALVRSIDGLSEVRVQFSQSKSIEKERAKLLELLCSRATDEHTLHKVQADMMYLESVRLGQIEQNFKKRGMDSRSAHLAAESEIEETYRQATRLVEYKSFVRDKAERSDLPPGRLAVACAEQIIAHSARPSEIDQGRHPSCSTATLEVRTFSRYPGRAAKFVADLAANAQFHGRMKGKSMNIDLDSLEAHQDARVLAPASRERGIASQIFQVGAFNMMYALNDPDLSYKQEEISTSAERGDRLYDRKSRYKNIPLNRDNWMLDAYEEIVGVKEAPWIVCRDWYHRKNGNDRARVVHSVEALQHLMQETEKEGNFPLSLTIDTNNDSMPDASGDKERNPGSGTHAVTAYGFRAGKVPKIEMDNQWGADNDCLADKALTVDRVYDMMNDSHAFKIQLPWEKPKKW